MRPVRYVFGLPVPLFPIPDSRFPHPTERPLARRIRRSDRRCSAGEDRELEHHMRQVAHAEPIRLHRHEALQSTARILDRKRAVAAKDDVDARDARIPVRADEPAKRVDVRECGRHSPPEHDHAAIDRHLGAIDIAVHADEEVHRPPAMLRIIGRVEPILANAR